MYTCQKMIERMRTKDIEQWLDPHKRYSIIEVEPLIPRQLMDTYDCPLNRRIYCLQRICPRVISIDSLLTSFFVYHLSTRKSTAIPQAWRGPDCPCSCTYPRTCCSNQRRMWQIWSQFRDQKHCGIRRGSQEQASEGLTGTFFNWW